MKKLLVFFVLLVTLVTWLEDKYPTPGRQGNMNEKLVTSSQLIMEDIHPLLYILPLSIVYMFYTAVKAKRVDRDEDEF